MVAVEQTTERSFRPRQPPEPVERLFERLRVLGQSDFARSDMRKHHAEFVHTVLRHMDATYAELWWIEAGEHEAPSLPCLARASRLEAWPARDRLAPFAEAHAAVRALRKDGLYRGSLGGLLGGGGVVLAASICLNGVACGALAVGHVEDEHTWSAAEVSALRRAGSTFAVHLSRMVQVIRIGDAEAPARGLSCAA